MSEGSLPPFRSIWLRFSPATLLRGPLGKVSARLRRRREAPPAATDLRSRAAVTLGEHTKAHAALFERASRLREKAERLERAGTPSESARNRAARAEWEAAENLAELRTSFTASAGDDGARAFDLEVRESYPALGASYARSNRRS
ncbi:MAG TPA: hypothetical protein VHM16_04925 [Rubrobacteraceae bacterium]|nr:hypothetical protein [Rubrobacteraceae bacterium]